MAQDKWTLIVNSYSQNPRDVITTPIGNRQGKWFHVSVKDCKVFISEAKQHFNSSTLKVQRMLAPSECDNVFELYMKRKSGVVNSKEVEDITMNGSYWFGIFSDLAL